MVSHTAYNGIGQIGNRYLKVLKMLDWCIPTCESKATLTSSSDTNTAIAAMLSAVNLLLHPSYQSNANQVHHAVL